MSIKTKIKYRLITTTPTRANNGATSQQTRNICTSFVQRWPNVFDVGPTLCKCHTNVLCLLGIDYETVVLAFLLTWLVGIVSWETVLYDYLMPSWISLKVIYHLLYGMSNYVLIWGDWLSCDPLRGSHDKETLVPHLVATLIYLSQNYSYYIRGDRSPLTYLVIYVRLQPSRHKTLNQCWSNVGPAS